MVVEVVVVRVAHHKLAHLVVQEEEVDQQILAVLDPPLNQEPLTQEHQSMLVMLVDQELVQMAALLVVVVALVALQQVNH